MSYKIMIIDDSKDMRTLLRLTFKPEGYEVMEACDGRQALAKLNEGKRPDLIFLDYIMDIMDGPEFLIALEQTHPEILDNVPIIMLTGKESYEVSKNRATEIVPKQIGIAPLLAIAKRYLH